MSTLSPSLRIGVLRGGPSPEYDNSLKSGAHVLKHLSETHRPIDIFISKDGAWHMHGVPRDPARILKHVDVVWNALHGAYGEDGKVQEILDRHGARYTGPARMPAALSMNKWITKEHAHKAGIQTPVYTIVRQSDPLRQIARQIFASVPQPLVVKPVAGGSSLGVYLTRNFRDLYVALETILAMHDAALVEQYIVGREATCGIIDDFRGHDTYALPVVEIITHPDRPFFDHHAKYSGMQSGETREMCPAHFDLDTKKEIERLAALIHRTLGLSHYSRSDFIVTPRRGVYFLEVNSLPGMTSESLLPKSLEAVGVSQREFIHHVLGLALNR